MDQRKTNAPIDNDMVEYRQREIEHALALIALASQAEDGVDYSDAIAWLAHGAVEKIRESIA